MPKEYSRVKRVASEIQKIVSQLIFNEINDPDLGMITVNDVEVSRDFSYAKVYVTSLNPKNEHEHCISILNQAAPYLRHCLGKQIKIRLTPELRFVYDKSAVEGAKIESLINSL